MSRILDCSAVTLEVWTRESGESAGAAAARVFARLLRGQLPVMGARVFARLERTGGGEQQPVRLELLDDGRGCPDATGSDGIYSAFVSNSALLGGGGGGEAAAAAAFSVAVTAINGGGARVPKIGGEGRGKGT